MTRHSLVRAQCILALQDHANQSCVAYLEPILSQVGEINGTVVQADEQVGSLDIFRYVMRTRGTVGLVC